MEKVMVVHQAKEWPCPEGYTSWRHYWETKTGLKKHICGTRDCSGTDVRGIIVRKAGGRDKRFYVTLLCGNCQRKQDIIEVIWPLIPVPEVMTFAM